MDSTKTINLQNEGLQTPVKATLILSPTLRSAKIAVDQKLKALCPFDLDQKNYVIVPDRSTLDAETALLKTLGGSFNTQVTTFKNFASRLINTQLNYLNKQNGILLISKIIEQKCQQFECFKKSYNTDGFAQKVYELISAFKYAMIKPQAINKDDLPDSLKSKVNDVKMLYQAYSDQIDQKFMDSADTLDLLIDALEQTDLTNHTFYLYDFLSFTKQEKAIIYKLLQKSKGVTVATVYNQSSSKNNAFDNAVAIAFRSICQELGIICDTQYFCSQDSVLSNTVYQAFFKGSKEFLTSKKPPLTKDASLFDQQTNFNPDQTDLSICVASNQDGEARILAEYVDAYVKSGGQYGDVKVVCSDVEQYSRSIFKHFADFDIPYYLDQKTLLVDTLPANYLLCLLDCFIYDFQLDKTLAFAKNPLTGIDCSEFETFCKKYNVNYRLDCFDIGTTDPLFSQADQTRQKLLELVGDAITDQMTATEYVEYLRRVIDKHELQKKTLEFAQNLKQYDEILASNALEQCLDKIQQVLTQVEVILGNEKIKLQKFVYAFYSSLASQTVSVLPQRTDCVFISNLDKGKDHDVKVLALLGANEGELPKVYRSFGLLSDKNLAQLRQTSLSPEISLAQKNRQERFSLYNLLTEPQQKLLIVYKLKNGKDDATPSNIVTALKKATGVNAILSPSFSSSKKTVQLKAIDAYVQKKQNKNLTTNQRYALFYAGNDAPCYDTFSQKVNNLNNGDLAFFSKDTFSVTKIEKYFECPFSCFLSNGLYLQKVQEAKFEVNDFGLILHAVFEKFVKYIIDVNLIKQKNPQSDVVITQKDAQRIFDEVIQDERYQAIMRTNKGKALVNRLKTEAVAHCMTILQEVESSAFKPYATEFKFDKPNKNQDADKCLSLKVGDKTIYLKGSADRVDVYQDKALIFDYKTGSPSYSAKELYDGTKLQLFVYASAVKKVLGKTPIGSVYYKVKTLSSNDDSCKIIGRVVSDLDTLTKIDQKVLNQYPDGMLGEVLTKQDKSGNRTINGKLSTYVPQSVFEDCQTYALNIIQKACQLMREGYIDVNPLKDACLYCPAKTMCGFDDTRVVVERKIPAVKEANISLILKED